MKGQAVNNFLSTLLTSLTTVFAWMPAGVLLIMPFIGIYTGLVYLDEMSIFRLCMLFILCAAGLAGFVGLTSISWGLKLKPFIRFCCLLCGAVALTSVIVIGSIFDMPITMSLTNFYLFICPLLFLVLHCFLDYRNLAKQPLA